MSTDNQTEHIVASALGGYRAGALAGQFSAVERETREAGEFAQLVASRFERNLPGYLVGVLQENDIVTAEVQVTSYRRVGGLLLMDYVSHHTIPPTVSSAAVKLPDAI